jgi:hypothetical protein
MKHSQSKALEKEGLRRDRSSGKWKGVNSHQFFIKGELENVWI